MIRFITIGCVDHRGTVNIPCPLGFFVFGFGFLLFFFFTFASTLPMMLKSGNN